MNSYELDQDEAVIMHAEDGLADDINRVDWVLTNKNLIQINRNNKEYEKYPLDELKVLDGKANVIVGTSNRGGKHLELYFNDIVKLMKVRGIMAENRWASAIIKAHKNLMKKKENGGFINSVKSMFGISKNNTTDSTPTINKCPTCGAILDGKKGSKVKCSYCDTVVIIK